ncbi:uncharacterized protein IL334_004085 [Kwoniella shivajii]|uniref:PH domain-containing protein n=1 Tax=Kwoniella shivajii TaxID=564305 RepID=A0ABZ1CZC7_9TREE|nr:hypothetical protein IL334_004085 [Kwoniella shivajii]
MPSVFSRNRRASDAPPSSFGKPDDSPSRPKRLSIDIITHNGTNGSPPPSGGKIKAFFGVGQPPDTDVKNSSLRKKLTSPSTFFKSSVDLSSPPPSKATPKTPPQSSSDDPALARYTDLSPRANRSPNNERFASPSLAPENFALASTSSPEGTPRQSRDGRRNSVTWQPSYPLVVPDDEYVNISPDGHAAPNGRSSLGSALTPSNENSRRRSLDAMNGLANWPAMKPTVKPITPPTSAETIPKTPPRQQAPLPTPPLSSPSPRSGGLHPPDFASGRRRPSLSIDISDVAAPGSTAALAAAQEEQSKPAAQPATNARPSSMARVSHVSLNDNVFTTSSSSVPASPMNSSRPRPNPPSRKSTLIQSPPMPQPIKNLPTLQGWPGFPQASAGISTPKTPGWGSLAREGGPKTPGFLGTPSGQRTPGGINGFPFSLPPVMTPSGKGKERSVLTEQELRKAKRAMPVMLRQPSTRPVEQEQGGDAGDDDDESDGESDPEMDGGHSDDDSDVETETEPRGSSTRGALSLAGRFSKKNKGKARASANVSPMAKSAVREEEGANGKSVWSLQTPTEKQPSSNWAQFGAGTPRATPGPRPTPGRAALIRNESSYASTATGSDGSSGYFDSLPTSQVNTAANTTPNRVVEPVLAKGSGGSELADSAAANDQPTILSPTTVSGPVEDDEAIEDDSDSASDVGTNEGTHEGSMESPPISSQQQVGPSPTQPLTTGLPSNMARPTPSTRPSLYSQVSRSMINLPPKPIAPESDQPAERISVRPRLETVPSGEQVPMHIDLPPKSPFGKFQQPNGSGPATPAAEWAKPPPTPAAGLSSFNFWSGEKKQQPALKRRRSADDMLKPPPGYEPPFPGTYIPRPRDEEGKEKLPSYWCSVHIEGMLPRKMEFTAPGQQARDRSWKKLYFIIHGTSFYIYKFDPHRFPLKVDAPVPTINEDEVDDSLHVHFPNERRGSSSSQIAPTSIRRGSISAVVGGNETRRGSIPENVYPSNQRRGSTAGLTNPLAGTGSTTSINGSGSRRLSETSSGISMPRRSSLSIVTNASDTNTNSSVLSPESQDIKDANLFANPGSGGSGSTATPRRPSISSTTATSSAGSSGGTSLASHFQHNSMVKQYSLQNAESGLAADYAKRKNVVRVRVNGEQFLLQTSDNREVVSWIEAFQAATNVALDLDVRPMPKIITLPRRRRRRGAPGTAARAGTATGAEAGASAATGTSDTASGNVAAVSAADAAERERERMLVEDQQAESIG